MYWLLLLLPLVTLCCVEPQGDKPGKPQVKPLAGWPGVLPEMPGWIRTFQQPAISKDAKTFSQTVRYEWSGGASKRLEVTLARDPDFKTKYDPKELQRQGNPPKKIEIGKNTARLWDVKDGKEKEGMSLQKKLVIVLAEDRVLQLDARGVGPWEPLEKLAGRFDLEKMSKALDAPPRSDFRRNVDAFRALKKGMSYRAVAEWVGDADRDIGSGIHVMVYGLDDGTRVLIGFPGFEKLIYVKHEAKPGQVMDLAK